MRFRFLSASLILFIAAAAHGQRRDVSWTIRGGSYQGDSVRLDLDLVAKRKSGFLRVSRIKSSPRLVGWNTSRLPARVAFRPNRGIAPVDSIAFWSTINEMERDIGMKLFVPATLAGDADPDDIVVVDLKDMTRDAGMTLVTWSTSGGVYDARVFFRSSETLHNARVVAHEMMHSLGFGHTTAWVSVMNPGPWAPASLTKEDVAYAQYAFDARAASEREDMWERLALADEREGGARRSESIVECGTVAYDNYDGIPMTKMRGLVGLSALSALAACGTGAEKNVDTGGTSAAVADSGVIAPDTAQKPVAAPITTTPANAPTTAKPRPPVSPPLAPEKKQ